MEILWVKIEINIAIVLTTNIKSKTNPKLTHFINVLLSTASSFVELVG